MKTLLFGSAPGTCGRGSTELAERARTDVTKNRTIILTTL